MCVVYYIHLFLVSHSCISNIFQQNNVEIQSPVCWKLTITLTFFILNSGVTPHWATTSAV